MQKTLRGDAPSGTLKPSALQRIRAAEAIANKEKTTITTSAQQKNSTPKTSCPQKAKFMAYHARALYESLTGNQEKAAAYEAKRQDPSSSINGNTFFHHHMALQTLLKPQGPGQR